MSYSVKSRYPWTDEEVFRIFAKNLGAWMAPEEMRRAHGLPRGCSQSHRLRPKLVELINKKWVEGKEVCPTWPQKGYEYRLTPAGIAHAQGMGWL